MLAVDGVGYTGKKPAKKRAQIKQMITESLHQGVSIPGDSHVYL
jgi:hypothetical protein